MAKQKSDVLSWNTQQIQTNVSYNYDTSPVSDYFYFLKPAK